MKHLLSQKGVSIVFAMVAFAIVASMSVALVRISKQSQMINTGNNLNFEIQQASLKIQRILEDNRSCNATFSNLPTTPIVGVFPPETSVLFQSDFMNPALRDIHGNPYFTIDDESRDKLFKITQFHIQRGKAGEDLNEHMLQLRVRFTANIDTFRLRAHNIWRTFKVYADFNETDHNFIRCRTKDTEIRKTARELACTQVKRGNFDPVSGNCSAPFQVSTFEISGGTPGTPATKDAPGQDYCALSRSEGEDGWKDSSLHHCEVAKVADGWRLISYREEARSNNCSMKCFKFAEGDDTSTDPGETSTDPDPLSIKDVAEVICAKFVECDSVGNILPDECINETIGILANEHFYPKFGLPAANQTLVFLDDEIDAGNPGAPVINPTNHGHCLNQITTLQCTDPLVQNSIPVTALPPPNYLAPTIPNIIDTSVNPGCFNIFDP